MECSAYFSSNAKVDAVSFHPDRNVEMYMVSEYGLQTRGEPNQVPQIMDALAMYTAEDCQSVLHLCQYHSGFRLNSLALRFSL